MKNEKTQEIILKLNIEKEIEKEYLAETLEEINQIYKTPVKSFLDSKASVISAVLSGIKKNPLSYVQVYETEDHFAFYSFLVAPKLGHDFSFKVSKEIGVDLEKCNNLLQHVATKILSKEIKIHMFLGIGIHPLEKEFQTKNMKAVIIINDPVVQPNEDYEYKLVFGINQETYDKIAIENGGISLNPWEDFIDSEFEGNPSMITKL
ncbi:hypothetical protein [Aureivirga sp. CE67]|uniref:hypothetical protein n=1 Tax=Aureivirga sp. CE67 TaxID=1788983 RepID=UPI0018CA9A16|nr:hypothetical protein [Aureivirga sp. CE67]